MKTLYTEYYRGTWYRMVETAPDEQVRCTDLWRYLKGNMETPPSRATFLSAIQRKDDHYTKYPTSFITNETVCWAIVVSSEPPENEWGIVTP